MQRNTNTHERAVVVLQRGQEVPVLVVRCTQIRNEIENLRARARATGGQRAAVMMRLAGGLTTALNTLVPQVPATQGVNVMATNNSKNGNVQNMCKVCGTMFSGPAVDTRPEPLAELCGRCEALVLRQKPNAGAAKRAQGNKAPKELIAELRVDYEALVEAGPVVPRDVPVEEHVPTPEMGNALGIVVEPQQASTIAVEAKPAKRTRKPKEAKPTTEASGTSGCAFYRSLEGFDKSQLTREAFRVLRLGFMVQEGERKLGKLRAKAEEAKGQGLATINDRITKLNDKYLKDTAALVGELERNPGWRTWAQEGGAVLLAGTPFIDYWRAIPGKLKDQLLDMADEGTSKASKAS